MKASLSYLLEGVLTLPILPLLWRDGKRVKATMPNLQAPVGNSFGLDSDQSIRMLALGESTIAGVGARDHRFALTGQMVQALQDQLGAPISMDIHALSGLKASDMVQRLGPGLPSREYDIIILGVGGNDAFQMTTPWEFRRHLQHLIEVLNFRFGACPMLFIHAPPVSQFEAFTPLLKTILGRQMWRLTHVLEQLTSKFANTYTIQENISIYDWMSRYDLSLPTSAFFSDGVHPSELTYRFWARDLTTFILDRNLLPRSQAKTTQSL